MTLSNRDIFIELKKIIAQEIKILNELNSLYDNLEKIKNPSERNMILFQINSLKKSLKQTNSNLPNSLTKFNLPYPLVQEKIQPQIQTQTPTLQKPIIETMLLVYSILN